MGAMGAIFGGGVDPGAASQAGKNLLGIATTSDAAQQQQQQNADIARQQAMNFWQNRLQTGLPFYRTMTDYSSGNIARAFAPQYGAINRATSLYGTNTPSGYRDAVTNNLRAQQGTAFDSSLTQAMMANEMAKQQAAAGMQGEQQIGQNAALAYGNLGAGANQAVLQAPQRGGILSALGGAAAGIGGTMTGMGAMKNAGFFGG